MKIKKIVLSLALMIGLVTYSQSDFAVFGGVKASTFTEGIIENVPAPSLGYQFGVLYDYKFSKKISFRPKVALSMQGDRSTQTIYSGLNLGTIRYRLTYINTSLDIKVNDDRKRRYLLFGPQFGFLVNTSKKVFDFGDPSKFDYGLKIGFGINIARFFVEIEYYQGFNTVIEICERTGLYSDSGCTSVKANNAALNLNVGFRL